MIFKSIMNWAMKKRIHQIELFQKYPHDVQNEWLFKLLDTAKNTEWGKRYDFSSVNSRQTFQERIPLTTYEELFPDIDRLMKGEGNILWPSKVEWFAKSSGTTNAKSKFIPVSSEALEDCHFKGGKDMLSIYVNNYPMRDLFDGKGLSIGGSHGSFPENRKVQFGDVSAVIMANLPIWAQFMRTPSLKVALMEEWEAKIAKMIEETEGENVTSLSGVPTWTLVLIQKILEKHGKKNLLEIWPNLELFAHGAVSFDPYRELFKELIPSSSMNYLEIYNASEGFFGIQDEPDKHEMLLMLDYGIYYEFIPMDEIDEENPTVLTLDQVELNHNYAMVITTNAGLWRYKIGDTVRFTSVDPYRIRITGRTKHFINAFGEELIIENAEDAIRYACHHTDSVITNFTAAPIYFEGKSRGGHQWLIEFEKPPKDLEYFNYALDKRLKEVNSDYEAKRYKDIALQAPEIRALPKGTFYKWMERRGKLGGQNKVPRLSNSREYVDDLLEMLA